MKSILLIVAFLLLSCAKLTAQCAFGNFPPSYTTAANFGANYLLGDSYSLASTSTLTALALKGNGTGATVRMAIYSNTGGLPNTLVAYTNTTTVGSGTVIIPVITPTVLPAGTYWIMACYSGGSSTGHANYTTASTKTVAYISLTPANLPPTTASWLTYTGQDFDYWGVLQGSITLSITGNTSICAGQSASITASGATSYSWSTSASTASITVTPTVNAVYTVTGSSAGCSSSTNVSVTVNAAPTITVNSGAVCAGNSFTITPSGANTYSYSSGSAIVTPSANANYTVTGTNTLTTCSSTAISSVTVNTLPTVVVNSGTTCAGNSFTITPSGASTYTYSSGSAIVTPTTNTSYSVTGTSVQGCVSSNTAVSTVTVSALPSVTAVSSASLICAGQSASLTASGANTYSWNTSATATVIAISPTVTTSYTVSGTALNGCKNNAIVTQAVSACTGIEVIKGVEAVVINVYPNPSTGLFTIDLQNESTIIVVDVLGKIVYQEELKEGKQTINLSHLNNGLYFLKARNNAQFNTVRLIKE
jgi:hypothetical protein